MRWLYFSKYTKHPTHPINLAHPTLLGFSLVELLVVIAIIGILLAGAIPAYQGYVVQAKFSEVLRASAPFKLALEAVVMLGKASATTASASLRLLDGGKFSIPSDISNYDSQYVASITTIDGVITVTGKNFPADVAGGAPTYKLTAKDISSLGRIIYDDTASDEARGSCYSAGLCD